MRDRLVIVLGMHRSGTSAMSGSLRALDVELGDALLPPGPDNPAGYWEDADVYTLNEAILAALGQRWDTVAPIGDAQLMSPEMAPLRRRAVELLAQKLATAERFGLKDPRMCRLLGFWQGVFDELQVGARYVIVTRDPVSVAASLAARNELCPTKSYLLWLGHVVPAIVGTRGRPRTVVAYDRLIDDPARELRRVADALDLSLREDAVRELASEFLTSALRHQKGGVAGSLEGAPAALCRQAHERLSGYAVDHGRLEDPAEAREWDRMAVELERFSPLLRLIDAEETRQRDLDRQIQHLAHRHRADTMAVADRDERIAALADSVARLERAQTEVAQRETAVLTATIASLRKEIAALRASTSWRCTGPLRGVVRLARGLAGK